MTIEVKYDLEQLVFFITDNKIHEARITGVYAKVGHNSTLQEIKETIYVVKDLKTKDFFNIKEESLFPTKVELIESL